MVHVIVYLEMVYWIQYQGMDGSNKIFRSSV